MSTKQVARGALGFVLPLLLVGCPGVMNDTPKSGGVSRNAVTFHDPEVGLARVVVQLTRAGQRTQRFAEAASDPQFNAVRLVLSNPAKLRSPIVKSMACNSDGSPLYPTVFGGLPSDIQGGYVLTVGLYRNIASPSWPADPGFGTPSNRVGEGTSAAIELAAGTTATASIVINGLGTIRLGFAGQATDSPSPQIALGATAPFVEVPAVPSGNPAIDRLSLYVLDEAGAATLSTQTVSGWHASGGSTVSLSVPPATGSYLACLEARDSNDHVLSRCYQGFSVTYPPTCLLGATFSVPTGGFWTVDPFGNFWSMYPSSQQVKKVSKDGVLLGTYAVGASPTRYIVDRFGNCWCACYNAGAVYRISASGSVLACATGGTYPSGLNADSQGNIWVSDNYNSSVAKFANSGTRLGRYAIGDTSYYVAIDPSDNPWFSRNNRFSITPTTNNLVKLNASGINQGTYTVSVPPCDGKFDLNGNYWAILDPIWIDQTGSNSLVVIAPNGSVMRTIAQGTGTVLTDAAGHGWYEVPNGVVHCRVDGSVIDTWTLPGVVGGLTVDINGHGWTQLPGNVMVELIPSGP